MHVLDNEVEHLTLEETEAINFHNYTRILHIVMEANRYCDSNQAFGG